MQHVEITKYHQLYNNSYFLAPEEKPFKTEEAFSASLIWSLGLVIIILCTREEPSLMAKQVKLGNIPTISIIQNEEITGLIS
jgi:hypothetical protein